MTGMLASVKNLVEAEFVFNAKVDIIDLKQPEFGALGALPVELVTKIVEKINRRCPVSATVGDLPMNAEIIFNAVSEMAKTGVDFVKMGVSISTKPSLSKKSRINFIILCRTIRFLFIRSRLKSKYLYFILVSSPIS